MAFQNISRPRIYLNLFDYVSAVGAYEGLNNVYRTLPVGSMRGSGTVPSLSSQITLDNPFIAILGHDSTDVSVEGVVTVNPIINWGAAIKNGFSIADLTELPSAVIFNDGTGAGSILLGTYYEFPHSPDMSLTLDYSYEGIKEITTKGGASLSNSYFSGPPMWGNGLGAWELGSEAAVARGNDRAGISMLKTGRHKHRYTAESIGFGPEYNQPIAHHVHRIPSGGIGDYYGQPIPGGGLHDAHLTDGSHLHITDEAGDPPHYHFMYEGWHSHEEPNYGEHGMGHQIIGYPGPSNTGWDHTHTVVTEGGHSHQGGQQPPSPRGGERTLPNQKMAKSGRRIWSLNFSFLSDTDVFPENAGLSNEVDTDSDLTLLEDDTFQRVLAFTRGGMLPFIFQPDRDVAKPDSFAIAKFDMNSFKLTQTASNFYNVKLKIREVW